MWNCIKSQNQCINAILFPGAWASSSYDSETFANHRALRLIYIPFKRKVCTNFSYIDSAPTSIPALLCINRNNKANSFCIHFHGNACDIGQISVCGERESAAFNAHYLIVEYPGFGISNGYSNEVVLNEVARIVHDFVIHDLKVNPNRIVLFGRSIGTGPVCALASHLEAIGTPPSAVILQSPYTSIVDVTADLLGCVSFCMINRWTNWRHLIGTSSDVIKAPVLFIHADNDKIIDCNHSKMIYEYRRKYNLPAVLYIQQSTEKLIKGHNYFDYEKDMLIPARDFLWDHVPRESTREPLELPMNVIQAVSVAPPEYRALPPEPPVINISDQPAGLPPSGSSESIASNNSKSTTSTVQPQKSKSKCTYSVLACWTCCPCMVCCEGCIGCHMQLCMRCVQFTVLPPLFDYQRVKPPEAVRGSFRQVLFRRASFNRNVREEAHAKSIADSRKAKSKRMSGTLANDDVRNPLVVEAFPEKYQSTAESTPAVSNDAKFQIDQAFDAAEGRPSRAARYSASGAHQSHRGDLEDEPFGLILRSASGPASVDHTQQTTSSSLGPPNNDLDYVPG